MRFIFLLSAFFLLLPRTSRAFSSDLIIGDREFTDAESMNLADVQQFLNGRQSPLASRILPDSEGYAKFATEIIFFAAREARMNPKVLLTMLQKEQSLVLDSTPTSRQFDYAMGYGCPDGSGCNSRFQGFGKQVRGAALQLRAYLDDLAAKGETIARWAIGRSKTTGDGYAVTPKNAATAALYTYTPWRGTDAGAGGNLSFARIWREWFGGGAYPDGAVLRGPDDQAWRIENGKRRRFATLGVLRSYVADAKIITASADTIATYVEGAPIRFTNYSVVEDPDSIRWLLVGNAKRRIASRDVFRRLGYNPEEVESATVADLAAYQESVPITATSDDPRGTFVRERESGKLYAVTGMTKQPILDQTIARAHFGDAKPEVRNAKTLVKLRTIAPLIFPDGELVTAPKSLPQVFVISKGERRPFVSPRIFEQLGYQWANVTKTTDAALELHPIGASITDEIAEIVIAAPVITTAPIVSSLTPPNRDPYLRGLTLF
ncbi:MAG: hypothetical protein V1723_01235 [Candidatus Uhrbacteria bacterium]